MISPEDIKKQALKWWKLFLQSYILGQNFFPKAIDRIGKIKSSQVLTDIIGLQDQVARLYNHSKLRLGFGYVVRTAETTFRRTGSHELPDYIVFESADDYIRFIGKSKEWEFFLQSYKIVIEAIPQLNDWCLSNSEQLTVSARNWLDILKVCQYFMANPRPELYIRQLPIEVHTKFIESNDTILKSLLDVLICDHIRDKGKKSFAERYYLKYDEPPQIRLRILDNRLAITNLTDLLVKLSDFKEMNIPGQNVILTENKMNFLSLPEVAETIAIWSGGGFNISHLTGVKWLSVKNIYYWGDLDIQGLQLLHQVRSYFPQTKSMMMDWATLNDFTSEVGRGEPGYINNLDHLTTDERALFEYLKEGNLRLEQEKINQRYVDEMVKCTINFSTQ